MTTATKKRLTPRTARTLTQVCKLRRDNLTVGDYWIVVDGWEVTIAAQKLGESATGKVSLPYRVFNRIVDFYNGSHER